MHRIHRGAYAIGHPAVTRHGRCLAAVLASGTRGIPTTAIPRTLLDLSAAVSERSLGNAIERAERLALLDLVAIDDLLGRCGRHRGARLLLRTLDIYRDSAFTRSRQERLLLALARKAGLPRPAMNVFVAGHEIDAYWEEERFAVEVDGWDTHRTRAAFENDRLRQEDLKLSGIDSIRLTARRIEREPDQVAARLAQLLERGPRQVERESARG